MRGDRINEGFFTRKCMGVSAGHTNKVAVIMG